MADQDRLEELRRRIQKDPASLAFAQLAEEYRRAGRYEDAIRLCRDGLSHHPSYLSARVTLGRALLAIGDIQPAENELEAVLQSAPDNLAALRGLADIHQQRGHTAEALSRYRAALALAPDDAELRRAVASLAGPAEDPAHAGTSVSAASPESGHPDPVPAPSPAPRPMQATSAQPAIAALESWLAAIRADRAATE